MPAAGRPLTPLEWHGTCQQLAARAMLRQQLRQSVSLSVAVGSRATTRPPQGADIFDDVGQVHMEVGEVCPGCMRGTLAIKDIKVHCATPQKLFAQLVR